jgi:hypothetical protein
MENNGGDVMMFDSIRIAVFILLSFMFGYTLRGEMIYKSMVGNAVKIADIGEMKKK